MKIFNILKEYTALTLATCVMNIGIYVFKFPNNFSFGGVSGLSVVLSSAFGVSASGCNLVINMLLILLGFLFLGRTFGIKTVYVSVLSSVGLSLMERFFPMNAPVTDQPMLELIFAILLPALASAVLFNMDASGGGTDILAMILKKYAGHEPEQHGVNFIPRVIFLPVQRFVDIICSCDDEQGEKLCFLF